MQFNTQAKRILFLLLIIGNYYSTNASDISNEEIEEIYTSNYAQQESNDEEIRLDEDEIRVAPLINFQQNIMPFKVGFEFQEENGLCP
ncbi:MAG: hypothetical protein H0U27_10770, partial [Nitrosopumilus sp.]|nr:hypothetical protein [Nitrosopumilus sp.]